MSAPRIGAPSPFAVRSRVLLRVWAALLGLMLLSCGSAYLDLGTGNAVASLVIAALKAALVAWWFMQLRIESSTVRTVALVALFMLGLLAILSGVDYSTRLAEPAAVQTAQQLRPLLPQR